MESINRNKASRRLGAFYDAYTAAQGAGESVKAHSKELKSLTGSIPSEDFSEFKRDFAGGI